MMKQTSLIMGMPITVEVVDATVMQDDLETVFAYFVSVDETFSTYKTTSEISKINAGELLASQYSEDMNAILALSAQTKADTAGYFDIQHDGIYDPSGLVKGGPFIMLPTYCGPDPSTIFMLRPAEIFKCLARKTIIPGGLVSVIRSSIVKS